MNKSLKNKYFQFHYIKRGILMKIKSFSLNPEKWEGFGFVGGFGGYFFVLVVVF